MVNLSYPMGGAMTFHPPQIHVHNNSLPNTAKISTSSNWCYRQLGQPSKMFSMVLLEVYTYRNFMLGIAVSNYAMEYSIDVADFKLAYKNPVIRSASSMRVRQPQRRHCSDISFTKRGYTYVSRCKLGDNEIRNRKHVYATRKQGLGYNESFFCSHTHSPSTKT